MYRYSFYLSGGVYCDVKASNMDEACREVRKLHPHRDILVTLAVFPIPMNGTDYHKFGEC